MLDQPVISDQRVDGKIATMNTEQSGYDQKPQAKSLTRFDDDNVSFEDDIEKVS